jgi:crotonobetainyl-CoA:carnitine CoA-transferase CaiB-like acyl-CoA transferase
MQSMSDRIFRTIGRPELIDDPRFRTNDDRVRHRDELDIIIGDFICQRTQDENLQLFQAADVTVGPVRSVPELLNDPYVAGREVIVEVQDTKTEALPMHNIVPRFSKTPGVLTRQAPEVGEHNAELLAELDITGRPGT